MADEDNERVKAAVREERVTARLEAHDRQFGLLTETLQRNAQRFDHFDKALGELGESVDRLSESERVREAVSQALHKEVQQANEKQISRRQLWFAVAAIIATILGGFLASAHVFG